MLRRGVRNTLQTEKDLEICGEAVDGQDVVDKARELHPDLVILDINMPVLNGLVAVRQILRYCPTTKIVIFSVHDSDQTKQEIIAAGAHGFVSKGKDSHDLLRVVRDVLKKIFRPHRPLPVSKVQTPANSSAVNLPRDRYCHFFIFLLINTDCRFSAFITQWCKRAVSAHSPMCLCHLAFKFSVWRRGQGI